MESVFLRPNLTLCFKESEQIFIYFVRFNYVLMEASKSASQRTCPAHVMRNFHKWEIDFSRVFLLAFIVGHLEQGCSQAFVAARPATNLSCR